MTNKKNKTATAVTPATEPKGPAATVPRIPTEIEKSGPAESGGSAPEPADSDSSKPPADDPKPDPPAENEEEPVAETKVFSYLIWCDPKKVKSKLSQLNNDEEKGAEWFRLTSAELKERGHLRKTARVRLGCVLDI